MSNLMEALGERLDKMQIKTIVQTGFINLALTNKLAEYGEVFFYTPATFNPFEDNEKVHVNSEVPHFVEALGFERKHGSVDVLVLGGMKDYSSIRTALGSWGPVVRLNGLIVIMHAENEGIYDSVYDYAGQVELEAFEIEKFDDYIFLTPIK